MAEEQTAHWPRFTLVTYAAPTGIPHGWDAELLEKGAPDGLVCEAASESPIDHVLKRTVIGAHQAEMLLRSAAH